MLENPVMVCFCLALQDGIVFANDLDHIGVLRCNEEQNMRRASCRYDLGCLK